MGTNAAAGGLDIGMRLAAGVGCLVAVVLLCFVGLQVDQEARSAIYGAEWVAEGKCCLYSITWADVSRSAAVAISGVPTVAALGYLAMILVRVAAVGAAAAATQTRRTYLAVAVVGGWTLVFLAIGWRP